MRVTLITGCSSGIGRAASLYLARRGYEVFASMRRPEVDGAELAAVAQAERLPLELLALDVADPDSCAQAVAHILQQRGRIDVLVNNAGLAEGGFVEEMPEAAIRRMFDVNFFGALRLMQLVVPSMRVAQSGTIVNVSSIMGRLARAGGSAYAASKFALEAASEALAQEVRRYNVRVVLIEPGVVKTRLHEPKGTPAPEDTDSPYQEFTLRGRRLFGTLLQNPSQPEDVAQVIHEAVETQSPRLRYLVGNDARKWAAGRGRLTDEEWVDVGRAMTLDAYVAFYKEAFELEI